MKTTFYNFNAQLFESQLSTVKYMYVCGSQMFIYQMSNGLAHAANVDGFFMPTVCLEELKDDLKQIGVTTVYLNLHPATTEASFLNYAEAAEAKLGVQDLTALPQVSSYSKSIKQKLLQAESADWVDVDGRMFVELYSTQHYVDKDARVKICQEVSHCEWVGISAGKDQFSYACFGIGNGIVEYLLAASSESGRWLQAGLVYRMMQRYAERGFRLMNLGGGIRAGDGLEKFKIRLSGQTIPKRTVKIVIDEAAYRKAHIDASLMDRFPPYT